MDADDSRRFVLQLILSNNTLINQALSKTFIADSAVAILLWAVSLFSKGIIGRVAAVFDGVTAIASLTAVLVGQMALSVHGVGLLIASLTIWNLMVAFLLIRNAGSV